MQSPRYGRFFVHRSDGGNCSTFVAFSVIRKTGNVVLNYDPSESFSDYCNGGRWKRVQEALPDGASALTCVIVFGGMNMNAKGYASSEGAIIVGGSFRKKARESTYAKSALGTFPGLKFPKVRLVNRIHLHSSSPFFLLITYR